LDCGRLKRNSRDAYARGLKNDRAAGHAILFNKPVLKKPRAKGPMVDPIPLLVVAGLVLLLVTWVWRRFRGRVAASRWTFLRT
jgi:hypothetical protein